MSTPENKLRPESGQAEMDGLVRAASDIAASRNRTMIECREALKAGDDKKALALLKELCGLYDEPVQKPS